VHYGEQEKTSKLVLLESGVFCEVLG